MLTVRKSITLTGSSVIEGVIAESYSATINDENPKDMNLSSWQVDKQAYKKNRTSCREDAAEFEDMAYTLQDEMIANLAMLKVEEEDEQNGTKSDETV